MESDVFAGDPSVLKVAQTVNHNFVIDDQVRDDSELGVYDCFVQRINSYFIDLLYKYRQLNDSNCGFIFSGFDCEGDFCLAFIQANDFKLSATF